MSRSRNTLLFALVFALLKLTVDVYQAFYHGVGLHLPSVLFAIAAFSVAGAVGHFIGLAVLGRPLRRRAVPFVAIISFFVSVSLAHLLSSVVTTLPVFLAGLCAVSFAVTVRIGPRWD
jgi:hypothetical protein